MLEPAAALHGASDVFTLHRNRICDRGAIASPLIEDDQLRDRQRMRALTDDMLKDGNWR
jgi:hypothetical protein